MSNMISEKVRDNLFHSFAAVEAAAPAIKAAIIPSLALAEGESAPFARAEGIAATLVDMLIEQARPIVEGGQVRGVDALAVRHRLQGIDGRHYSRFGDALSAVLKDVLGPRLPSEVTAAWGDAFWFVIRQLMRSLPSRPASAEGEIGDRARRTVSG